MFSNLLTFFKLTLLKFSAIIIVKFFPLSIQKIFMKLPFISLINLRIRISAVLGQYSLAFHFTFHPFSLILYYKFIFIENMLSLPMFFFILILSLITLKNFKFYWLWFIFWVFQLINLFRLKFMTFFNLRFQLFLLIQLLLQIIYLLS